MSEAMDRILLFDLVVENALSATGENSIQLAGQTAWCFQHYDKMEMEALVDTAHKYADKHREN